MRRRTSSADRPRRGSTGAGAAEPLLHKNRSGPGWHGCEQERGGRQFRPARATAVLRGAARALRHRQLQGDTTHQRPPGSGGADPRRRFSGSLACTAMSTASSATLVLSSRCCRRKTPPEISSKSPSGSRSGSRLTIPERRFVETRPGCRSKCGSSLAATRDCWTSSTSRFARQAVRNRKIITMPAALFLEPTGQDFPR